MDFIEKCFEQNIVAFTVKLESAGFSAEQAEEFLPETASGIMHFIKKYGPGNNNWDISIGRSRSDIKFS